MHQIRVIDAKFVILVVSAWAVLTQATAADLTPMGRSRYDNIRKNALAAVSGPRDHAKRGPMAKLGLDLATVYFEYRDFATGAGSPEDLATFVSRNPLLRINRGTVVIDTVATGSVSSLRDKLTSLGMTHAAVYGRVVSGSLPIAALADVAALPSLRLARAAMSRTRAGLVTSQGDVAQQSDMARATYAVDGTGVTLGSLSDSFDCLGQAGADVASGDLPGGIVVLAEDPGCGSGTDEGRAIMQIIRDVAPGAAQAFHTANGGIANFASGIVDLATIGGADIIIDDVIYFAEPMFQDGAIAQAVDSVEAMGVAYFSSAGNDARQSYEASYVNSGQQGRLAGSLLHDFDPGAGTDVLQQVTIGAATQVIFVLQWQEPFFSVSGAPGSASDLDIVLYTPQGVARAGGIDANIGGDPVEVFGYTNPAGTDKTFQIGIELVSGPAPGLIKYVWFGDMTIDEFATNSGTVYGHANAAGAEAVGAARYTQTPAFGVDPPQLESFSSAGGTPVLFDTAGNPVTENRDKPEIVAPNGGDNTFFGFDYESNGFPNFFGTSASAPHAAGVAALMLEFDSGLTPDEVITTLHDTAIDMDAAGFDLNTGYGFIQADLALAALDPDTDADGEGDTMDNCTNVPNGPVIPDAGGNVQLDTDGDGYGNACDADLNNDGVVNGLDVGPFTSEFGTTGPDADFNGDGVVNGLDVGVFTDAFGNVPGPSGLAP